MTRVLVTGGAGFIGGHLVRSLCQRATVESVTVVDNLRRGSTAAIEPWVSRGMVRFLEGDIRDAALMHTAAAGVNTIFHLAAQSNVLGSESDPDYAFTTNVIGTQIVAQAAQDAGAQRLVFTTSREVYGQPASLPVPERAALAPKNMYGASKAAGEMLLRAAAARGGLDVVALRLANVYGPGDSGRVIPLWLERAARGEPLIIYGGRQVLDLVWVGDVVAALLRAADLPAAQLIANADGEREPATGGSYSVINVGSGVGTPIRDLAERVRALFSPQVEILMAPARTAEVEMFVADIGRMRAALELNPTQPLAYLATVAAYNGAPPTA